MSTIHAMISNLNQDKKEAPMFKDYREFKSHIQQTKIERDAYWAHIVRFYPEILQDVSENTSKKVAVDLGLDTTKFVQVYAMLRGLRENVGLARMITRVQKCMKKGGC